MHTITESEFKQLALADNDVTKMQISPDGMEITIAVDGGAFSMQDGKHQHFNVFSLQATSKSQIESRIYDHINKQWLRNEKHDTLETICEITSDNDIILSGFGRDTGMWLTFIVPKPITVTATLEGLALPQQGLYNPSGH